MTIENEVPETPAPEVPEPFVEVLPDTPAPEKQVTMSQSQLDQLIKSRQAAALKRAAALEKEVTLLKEQMVGSAPDSDLLEKTRGELASARIEADSLRQKQIDSARDLLISEHSTEFFDLDTIKKLTRQNLQHDGKSFVVVDDSGAPRLNAAGEPMTVKEFYTEFANNKPWLARGELKHFGQGSKPTTDLGPAVESFPLNQIFGKGSSGQLANELAQKNPQKYKALKMAAQKAGLI